MSSPNPSLEDGWRLVPTVSPEAWLARAKKLLGADAGEAEIVWAAMLDTVPARMTQDNQASVERLRALLPDDDALDAMTDYTVSGADLRAILALSCPSEDIGDGWLRVKLLDEAAAECARVSTETKFSSDLGNQFRRGYKAGADTCRAALSLMAREASRGLTLRSPPDIDRSGVALEVGRCEYCGDTGDVHRTDGEWLGECTCGRAMPLAR